MNFFVAENALRTKDLLGNLQSRVEFEPMQYGEAYIAGICKAYADLTPGSQIYLESFVSKRVHELRAVNASLKGFYIGYLHMASAICYDACVKLCPPSFESAKERIKEYFADPVGEDFSIEGGMKDDKGVTRLYNSGLYDRLKTREERYFKIKCEAQILPKYLC